MKNLEAGSKVKLKSFCGRKTVRPGISPAENYWILIGRTGRVVQSPHQRTLFASFSHQKKVLVRFDESLADLSLECHNEVPNSLWILIRDLEPVLPAKKSGNQYQPLKRVGPAKH